MMIALVCALAALLCISIGINIVTLVGWSRTLRLLIAAKDEIRLSEHTEETR
jgi:hypothetical protein